MNGKRSLAAYRLPWLMLLFSLAGFSLFYSIPFLLSFAYTLIDNPIHREFTGIQNYVNLFHNVYFMRGLKNTCIFMVISIPLNMILSLGVAMVIRNMRHYPDFFSLLFLIPLAIPSATSAFFWESFFGLHGTLNRFLFMFHIEGIDWLNGDYGMVVMGAAYQLFGSEDCVGQAIFLNRVSYQVVGIVREQGKGAKAKIYIPYTVLENMGVELSIEQLWCRFENLAEAALVLDQMGYSLKKVDIVQTSILKGLFMQRFWILVILIDFYFMTYLLSRFIRQKRQSERKLLQCVLLLFGSAVGIGLAFKAVKMAAYVPPAFELSEESWITVVYKLFDFYLLADINISYWPFLRYWNMFSLLSFVICLISGSSILQYRRYAISHCKTPQQRICTGIKSINYTHYQNCLPNFRYNE